MRFTVLATAALLSAVPAFAAPDAATLIDGYDRLTALGEDHYAITKRLTLTNAAVTLPQMVASLAQISSEVSQQADLVRDGVEPYSDEEQAALCSSFGDMTDISGQCLDALANKGGLLSALQGTGLVAPLTSGLVGVAEPYDVMVTGFKQAAPNCAQETLDNGPDISGGIQQAIGQLSGGL